MSKSAEFTAAAKKKSFSIALISTRLFCAKQFTVWNYIFTLCPIRDDQHNLQIQYCVNWKLHDLFFYSDYIQFTRHETRTSLSSRSLWNFKLSFFSFFKVSLFSNRKVTAISPSHDEKQLCNTSRGVEENFLFFSPFFPFFPPFHSPFARCAPCKTL